MRSWAEKVWSRGKVAEVLTTDLLSHAPLIFALALAHPRFTLSLTLYNFTTTRKREPTHETSAARQGVWGVPPEKYTQATYSR